MLKLEGVSVSIGPTPILRDVSLEVPPGTMCGLIGRNGAGKTTLMRAVMGALRIQSGSLKFLDEDLGGRSAHHRAALGTVLIADRKLERARRFRKAEHCGKCLFEGLNPRAAGADQGSVDIE